MLNLQDLLRDKKVLLFDFDGVIADTEGLKGECYRQAFDELLGVRLDPENVGWVGLPEIGVVKFWLSLVGRETGDADLNQKLILRKRTLYKSLIAGGKVEAIPGAVDFVRSLPLPFGIVSGSTREQVRLISDVLGLAAPAFVIGSDDVQRGKPDPQPYLSALQRAQIGPEVALAFEDSVAGITASVGAGIDTVQVLGPATNPDPRVLHAIENFMEIHSESN